jgi:hypothetical protein
VIYESLPWKQRLRRDAAMIKKWAKKPATERRSQIIEERIFIAAYLIRKLLEAEKLSSHFRERLIPCRIYAPCDGSPAPPWRPVERSYDFSSHRNESLPIPKLLNMIIHSHHFAEVMDDIQGSVKAFLVNSARTKCSGLWEVCLVDYIHLLDAVAEDSPSQRISAFDPRTSAWVVWQGTDNPPPEFLQRYDEIGRLSAKKGDLAD